MSTVFIPAAEVANPFAAELDDTLIEVEPDAVPSASSFGCGSASCQLCSPVIYRCEHGIDYAKPVINNTAGRALDEEGCEHHDVTEEDE